MGKGFSGYLYQETAYLPIQSVSRYKHLLKPTQPSPYSPFFPFSHTPISDTCQLYPQYYSTAEESYFTA
jgi:hypothetical protein